MMQNAAYDAAKRDSDYNATLLAQAALAPAEEARHQQEEQLLYLRNVLQVHMLMSQAFR